MRSTPPIGTGQTCPESKSGWRGHERSRIPSVMGSDIPREHFDADDYPRFSARLQENLAALARTLARPGIGAGAPSIGAELELALVDDDHRPLPLNRAVWSGTLD